MVNSSNRRVVITGVGSVSPLGNDTDIMLESLRNGDSGIRPLTAVPSDVLKINHGAEAVEFTGHISNYGPLEKPLQRTIRKGSKVMCREIEMGVAVAQLALHDAGYNVDDFDRDRTGVIYGCDYIMSMPEEYAAGIQGCLDENGEFDFKRWGDDGLPNVSPLWLLKYLPNMPASHIAIYNDLRGPNNSITLREASAGAAVMEAHSTITRGHADALIVGATGSRIHPLRTLHAELQEKLATTQDDETTMSRPFSASRDGSVVGEGAGALICETIEHAKKRGATVLGEIVGCGSSAVGPAFGETFLEVAMTNVLRAALGDADPSTIGHIHAHGLSTLECDAAEAAAIRNVFGEPANQPPVTTVKGHMGNLGGGSGMVEIIASLKSLGGNLFPIRNLSAIDPDCPINGVTDSSTPAGSQFISLNVSPQGQASAVRISLFS